jgi:predicted site-specific integrase-resolvase
MNIATELRKRNSLLTAQETANIMGTCIATVRRYSASGKLPSVRIGNRLRYDPNVVAEFLESRSSE